MTNYKKLSDIEAMPIPRLLTGFKELDFIYDSSTLIDGRSIWGIPAGKISLWAGESGIGKSRLAIEVAKKVSLIGNKVLYFQTESDLSDFASWAKNTTGLDNFYCSGADTMEEIIDTIYKINPALIFIDSVNEIEDFNGSSKSSKRLIKGDGVSVGFKQVIKEVSHLNGGCHLILLGQLNENKSIKGGTALPHLVDIALNLAAYADGDGSFFTVRVGVKNRCGRKGNEIYGIWKHTDNGVECISDNRVCDSKWCSTHDMKTYSRVEMIYEVHKGGSLPDPDLGYKDKKSIFKKLLLKR